MTIWRVVPGIHALSWFPQCGCGALQFKLIFLYCVIAVGNCHLYILLLISCITAQICKFLFQIVPFLNIIFMCRVRNLCNSDCYVCSFWWLHILLSCFDSMHVLLKWILALEFKKKTRVSYSWLYSHYIRDYRCYIATRGRTQWATMSSRCVGTAFGL